MAAHRLVSFDPFVADRAKQDPILTTSLGDARAMMAEAFAYHDAGGRPFRVFPLFVEKPTPNAFADDWNGLQVCGVNIGLVSAAYELGLFVFAQSAMFRDVGNAACERSPRLPPDAALSYWIADRIRVGEGRDGRAVGAELTPRDGQRQMAALFLTVLMLRFVWLHELFHCLNGHTGLRASQRKASALQEMADDAVLGFIEVEERPAAAQVSETYCMEFDADRTAFWAMVRRQIDDAEPISGIAALPRTLRLRLTVFAGVLMTFLFDQAERRRMNKADGSYPVAYHRLHNLVRTYASNLLDAGEEMRQVFAHTVVEMDYFQGCIPQAVSGSQLLRDLRSDELQRDFDKMDAALAAARPRFTGYASRHLLSSRLK